MKYVIGLDPGTTETGVCALQKSDYRPIFVEKMANHDVLGFIDNFLSGTGAQISDVEVAIEMVASYGMPVGAEVFETCVWIGRFLQTMLNHGISCYYVYRKDEKLAICQSPKANDATIKQALVDRFAYNVPNHGKGSKAKPGWFYGFSKDMWSAYAVAVTFIDANRSLALN